MLGNRNNKTITKSDIPTVLHLCSAHILHRIRYKLDRINKLDKKVKRLALHSFGTMVKSNNIEEIRLVFESLCIQVTSSYSEFIRFGKTCQGKFRNQVF